jgi:hypothetical protein
VVDLLTKDNQPVASAQPRTETSGGSLGDTYMATLWQFQAGVPRLLRTECVFRPTSQSTRVDTAPAAIAQGLDAWRLRLAEEPFIHQLDHLALRAVAADDFPTSFLHRFNTSVYPPWSAQQVGQLYNESVSSWGRQQAKSQPHGLCQSPGQPASGYLWRPFHGLRQEPRPKRSDNSDDSTAWPTLPTPIAEGIF